MGRVRPGLLEPMIRFLLVDRDNRFVLVGLNAIEAWDPVWITGDFELGGAGPFESDPGVLSARRFELIEVTCGCAFYRERA